MDDFGAIVDLLKRESRFLLLLHRLPDGDTVGSSLGLAWVLRTAGRQVLVVSTDEIPPHYRFLPGAGEVLTPHMLPEGPLGAGMVLDTTHPRRLGEAAKLLHRCRTVVNIDHHITNEQFGDLNYVDPSAAAVGEQVFRLLVEAGLPIDDKAATCLYAALVTDTGSFSYQNTTAITHRIAGELVRMGARPREVVENLFERRRLAALKLLGKGLDTLRLSHEGTVAWMVISRRMMREVGATDGDCEGLVDYPRTIAGVEVAVLFREMEDGQVRVTFRSRRCTDVAALAREWGGGGHPRAAGCVLEGPLWSVVETVIRRVEQVVAQARG